MVHNGGFYLPGNFSMEWTRCQSENHFAKLLQTEALDFITFNLKFCAAAGAFAIFSGSRRRESGGGRMGTTSLKRARVRTGLAETEQQRNPSIALYYISLLSGLGNIDDQKRNPNMNNRDHLVGRARTAVQPRTCAEGTILPDCDWNQEFTLFICRYVNNW